LIPEVWTAPKFLLAMTVHSQFMTEKTGESKKTWQSSRDMNPGSRSRLRSIFTMPATNPPSRVSRSNSQDVNSHTRINNQRRQYCGILIHCSSPSSIVVKIVAHKWNDGDSTSHENDVATKSKGPGKPHHSLTGRPSQNAESIA
jgi:hypothetical protein